MPMDPKTSPDAKGHADTLLDRAIKRQLAMLDRAKAVPQPTLALMQDTWRQRTPPKLAWKV